MSAHLGLIVAFPGEDSDFNISATLYVYVCTCIISLVAGWVGCIIFDIHLLVALGGLQYTCWVLTLGL